MVDQCGNEQITKLTQVKLRASTVFSDVEDRFQSLSHSLFAALHLLRDQKDFSLQLTDLTDYVLPYFQHELLSKFTPMEIFDFEASKTYLEVQDFIKSYPDYER